MPYVDPGGCDRCRGGSSGGTGVYIEHSELTNNGHLLLTYDDGTVIDTGVLLSQSQMGHINDGLSNFDLSDGLDIQDGKLTMTIQMKLGNQTVDLQNGIFTLPEATENSFGIVKLSDDFEVNEDGQMRLNEVNIQKLIVDDGDELIIGG